MRRSLVVLPILVASFAVLAPRASGQEGTSVPVWSRAAPEGPRARFAHVSVWDTRREVLIVYGGAGRNGSELVLHDDLWTLDPNSGWKQTEQPKPWPASRMHAMSAFDSKRGVTWVFGGMGSDLGPRGDLWKLEWAGEPVKPKWTEVTPAGDKPPARYGGVLLYDAPRDRLVLHGGTSSQKLRDSVYADLWAFDIEKQTWSSKPCTAPARWQFATAFDEAGGVAYLHGGFGSRPVGTSDLWSLSLADDKWTQLEPGPKKTDRRVSAHAGVWDPVAGAAIFHGGTRGDEAPWADDVWSYRPTDNPKRRWRQVKLVDEGKTTPGSRAFHTLVWRPVVQGALLVGGTENLVDDKVWDSDVWMLKLHD